MILVRIRFRSGYVSSHRILVIEGFTQELDLPFFSIPPTYAISM